MRTLILALVTASMLAAAPALQEARNFLQNDGSSFSGMLQGDEWFHWVQTGAGYAAKYNAQSGNYEYILITLEGSAARYDFSGIAVVKGDAEELPEALRASARPSAEAVRLLWLQERGRSG